MGNKQNLIVGQHYPAIDGLRGLAVLLVLWFHSSYFTIIGLNQSLTGITYSYYLLSVLGETGVDMFFVLSGFLITGILIDTAGDKDQLKKFYIRRSLRIFPLYYTVLFFFLSYFLFMYGSGGLDQVKILTHLFYIQNWSFEYNFDAFMLLNHTWSLAVEEQFYLFWPLLLLSFYKRSFKNAMYLCIFMVLMSGGLRIILSETNYIKWSYTSTLCRVDGLAIGALLSILCIHYGDILKKNRAFFLYGMVISLFLVCAILFLNATTMTAHHVLIKNGLSLCGIFYFCLLAHIVLSDNRGAVQKLFTFKPLRNVGRVSYGMYIFHVPIMLIIGKNLLGYELSYWSNHFILLGVGFLVSFIMAHLSYGFLEKPMLRLKDKYASLTLR